MICEFIARTNWANIKSYNLPNIKLLKHYLINYPFLYEYGQTIFCLCFLSRDRATAPGWYEYNTCYSQYIRKCILSGQNKPGCHWCFHSSVKPITMCTNFAIRLWFSCGSRCWKYLVLSPIQYGEIWLEGVVVLQLMRELKYGDLDNRARRDIYCDWCIGSVCLTCGVGKVVDSGQVTRWWRGVMARGVCNSWRAAREQKFPSATLEMLIAISTLATHMLPQYIFAHYAYCAEQYAHCTTFCAIWF
jgi:hypothetical protein